MSNSGINTTSLGGYLYASGQTAGGGASTGCNATGAAVGVGNNSGSGSGVGSLASLQQAAGPGWLGSLVIGVRDGAIISSAGCLGNEDRLAGPVIQLATRVGRFLIMQQQQQQHDVAMATPSTTVVARPLSGRQLSSSVKTQSTEQPVTGFRRITLNYPHCSYIITCVGDRIYMVKIQRTDLAHDSTLPDAASLVNLADVSSTTLPMAYNTSGNAATNSQNISRCGTRASSRPAPLQPRIDCPVSATVSSLLPFNTGGGGTTNLGDRQNVN